MTELDVRMHWPDADPTIAARHASRQAARDLAAYAAKHGRVMTSAPTLTWAEDGLYATAHTRPATRSVAHPEQLVPACAAHRDPDLWTSDNAADQERAVAVCESSCAVIDACLTSALVRGEKHGVYGGRVFPVGRRVAG